MSGSLHTVYSIYSRSLHYLMIFFCLRVCIVFFMCVHEWIWLSYSAYMNVNLDLWAFLLHLSKRKVQKCKIHKDYYERIRGETGCCETCSLKLKAVGGNVQWCVKWMIDRTEKKKGQNFSGSNSSDEILPLFSVSHHYKLHFF